VIHVFVDHNTHEAHSALEGELFDLEGNKPSLFTCCGIKDCCLVALESYGVDRCVENLII
jgi:hypothetical protein